MNKLNAAEIARSIHLLTNTAHGCRMEQDLIPLVEEIIQKALAAARQSASAPSPAPVRATKVDAALAQVRDCIEDHPLCSIHYWDVVADYIAKLEAQISRVRVVALKEAAALVRQRRTIQDTKINILIVGGNGGKTAAMASSIAETLMEELERDIWALTDAKPSEGASHG